MTNEKDFTPERIFVFKRTDGGNSWHYQRLDNSDVEYVRADLLATVRAEVEAEYALCRQVQKRGEHSSVTCPCVVAIEQVMRTEEREAAFSDFTAIVKQYIGACPGDAQLQLYAALKTATERD